MCGSTCLVAFLEFYTVPLAIGLELIHIKLEGIFGGFVILFQVKGLPDEQVAVVHPVAVFVQGHDDRHFLDSFIQVGLDRIGIFYGCILIDRKDFVVIVMILLVERDHAGFHQLIGIKPAVKPGGQIMIVLPYL